MAVLCTDWKLIVGTVGQRLLLSNRQVEAAVPSVREQSLLETRKQEKDRRSEEEFLKWWAAEEERIRTGFKGQDTMDVDV